MPSAARAVRFRRRLGCEDLRPFAPLPPRRRGRSQAYHDRLVAVILDEEARLVAYLGSIVYDLNRRLRVHRGHRHTERKHPRELVLYRTEHALADELGISLEEVRATLDMHPLEQDRDRYLRHALAQQLLLLDRLEVVFSKKAFGATPPPARCW